MFAKPRSNGKGLFDYICDNKLRGGITVCDCQNLGGQQADDLICRYLLDYAKEDSGICMLLEQLRQKIKAEDQSGKIEAVKRQIQKVEAELDRLAASMSQPELAPALVKRVSDRASELDRQREVYRAEQERLQSNEQAHSDSELQLDLMVHILAHFQESFDNLSIHEKRELVRLLVQRVEWDGENFDIFLYGE